MATRVTSKGQVTIPKRVRDYLGLTPGTPVEFDLSDDGRVIVRAAVPTERRSRFAKLRGSATAGMTTDEIMALTRGEPD